MLVPTLAFFRNIHCAAGAEDSYNDACLRLAKMHAPTKVVGNLDHKGGDRILAYDQAVATQKGGSDPSSKCEV